ncbi:hypothetical protein B7C62_23380 [Kitasatospora albolonga]|uniref:Uncharacterized protein n=1 Tax=Kitasatospora albolonga TaxID=68173 RepID=A0ABC8BYG6_9ACTN|nr:hypothetical protein B7C62_23380 [Kitasatospora albolonga]
MMRVKSLVRAANPLPALEAGQKGDALSDRARAELAALTGTPTLPSASRRVPRRGLLVAAGACTAAAVIVGVVAVLNGPYEPGGGVLADEPFYASTAELEEAADLIVLARLGAGREETVDGIDRTTVTAAVAATAKGAAPGRTVEVSYTTPGSGPETADLAEGKEYVLLLDAQDDGRFTLVNTTQGAYGVDGGRAVAGADNDVVLSAGVLKALSLTL